MNFSKIVYCVTNNYLWKLKISASNRVHILKNEKLAVQFFQKLAQAQNNRGKYPETMLKGFTNKKGLNALALGKMSVIYRYSLGEVLLYLIGLHFAFL